MKVVLTNQFEKFVLKLKDVLAKKRLLSIIEKLQKVDKLQDVSNVLNIVGLPDFYRIRIGDYRLIVLYNPNKNELILTVYLIDYVKRDEKTYKKHK